MQYQERSWIDPSFISIHSRIRLVLSLLSSSSVHSWWYNAPGHREGILRWGVLQWRRSLLWELLICSSVFSVLFWVIVRLALFITYCNAWAFAVDALRNANDELRVICSELNSANVMDEMQYYYCWHMLARLCMIDHRFSVACHECSCKGNVEWATTNIWNGRGRRMTTEYSVWCALGSRCSWLTV